jgi:hypothetical protein
MGMQASPHSLPFGQVQWPAPHTPPSPQSALEQQPASCAAQPPLHSDSFGGQPHVPFVQICWLPLHSAAEQHPVAGMHCCPQRLKPAPQSQAPPSQKPAMQSMLEQQPSIGMQAPQSRCPEAHSQVPASPQTRPPSQSSDEQHAAAGMQWPWHILKPALQGHWPQFILSPQPSL